MWKSPMLSKVQPIDKSLACEYNEYVIEYEILQGRVKFPIGGKVRERIAQDLV